MKHSQHHNTIVTIFFLLISLISCKKDKEDVIVNSESETKDSTLVDSIPQYYVCCEPRGYSRTDLTTTIKSQIGKSYGSGEYWDCLSGPHGPWIEFISDSTLDHGAHVGYGELKYDIYWDSSISKNVYQAYYPENSNSVFAKMYFEDDNYYELHYFEYSDPYLTEDEKNFDDIHNRRIRYDSDRTVVSKEWCDSTLIGYEYISE